MAPLAILELPKEETVAVDQSQTEAKKSDPEGTRSSQRSGAGEKLNVKIEYADYQRFLKAKAVENKPAVDKNQDKGKEEAKE